MKKHVYVRKTYYIRKVECGLPHPSQLFPRRMRGPELQCIIQFSYFKFLQELCITPHPLMLRRVRSATDRLTNYINQDGSDSLWFWDPAPPKSCIFVLFFLWWFSGTQTVHKSPTPLYVQDNRKRYLDWSNFFCRLLRPGNINGLRLKIFNR